MTSCRAAAVLVAAAATLVTGCVSVPTSGRVRPVTITAGGTGQGQAYLQPIPAPPGRGWTPRQIVSGFLAANASFAGDHAVARRYLLASASANWHPGWSVTVFSGGLTVQPGLAPVQAAPGRPGVSRPGTAEVEVSGHVLGSVNAAGQYTVSSAGTASSGGAGAGVADETFVLDKSAGQWRISSLPDRLLLTESDFLRVYQPRNLYFFDPAMRVLVPDPVYVPLADTPTDLVTGLVHALLNDPTGWLRGAARTAFPPGTKLRGDVTLDGSTAIVDVGGAAADAGDATLRRMSAQLVWTLSGSSADQPTMSSVELQVDGHSTVLPGSSGSPVQQIGMYRDDVPAGNPSASFYYIDGRGAVGTMSATASSGAALPQGRTVPGEAGSGAIPLSQVAVSPDGRYVAGLSTAGGAVYTGELRSGAVLSRRMSGGSVTSLSWDSHDDLWVVRGGSVWMMPAGGGTAVRADAGVLAGRHVTALRVAPDGVRCAMIVTTGRGSQLLLGAIVRAGQQAGIAAAVPITSTATHFTALTWYDADHVIALSQTTAGAQLAEIPINGAAPYRFPAEQGTVSITADGTANPIVAGLSDGQMVTLASLGGLWSAATGAGGNPAYPG